MADSTVMITDIRHENPIRAQLSTGEPFDVHMGMEVSALKTIPVCISVCEPICARSDYQITLTLFKEEVATISISGLTRIFNCRDERGTIAAEPAPVIAAEPAPVAPVTPVAPGAPV